MRISTHGIVFMAACVWLALLPLSGCKKSHKPDYSTPLGIVNSYIWAIDHHDCTVLEKVVAGRFKRHLEKRGKEGCIRIQKSYGKLRGKTKLSEIRVAKTGDPTIFFEEEGRAIVAVPLTRQDREEVAYFDVERTDRGWQVVGEDAKPPKWYTGPPPQLTRPDIRPEALPEAPKPPVLSPGPAPTGPAPTDTPAAPAPTDTPAAPAPTDTTTAPPAPPVDPAPEMSQPSMGEDDPAGEGQEPPPPPSDDESHEDHP